MVIARRQAVTCPVEGSAQLAAWAGLRNVLAHMYASIDLDRLFATLKEDKAVLRRFGRVATTELLADWQTLVSTEDDNELLRRGDEAPGGVEELTARESRRAVMGTTRLWGLTAPKVHRTFGRDRDRPGWRLLQKTGALPFYGRTISVEVRT